MNKLLLTITFFIIMIGAKAQSKVSGVVKDATTGKEIYNLTIRLEGSADAVTTDRIGYFQITNLNAGDYQIVIGGTNYEPITKEVHLDGNTDVDLGTIQVTYNPTNVNVGLITLTDDELASDESSQQSASGLLQSSRDVFTQIAAYELGAYWFRTRGLDNKYNDVLFNGIRMNKIDNGRATFNNWGGLNDITRRPDELTYGLDPSSYVFGDLGGVTNFDTRPSTLRKGFSVAYSATNRSYRNRAMVTYNSGLSAKGWGWTVSGSRRWAEEGWIDGTLYDAWALYLGGEKKFNDKHTLNLTVFGAPTRRSSASANTQEVVDLMGSDYNSYWGWQDGEKRNERIRKTFEPIAQLTHHWQITPKTKLTSTISYQYGKDSGSRLDFFNVNNPSPTYYQNLPSYIPYNGGTTDAYNQLVSDWKNHNVNTQLDWTSLYQANYIQNLSGKNAVYVVASDHTDDKTASFYSNLKTELAPNIELIAAVSYQNTVSDNYREIDDLLGGSYYLNKDAFLNISFNTEEDSNREVKKGDRYQYNYKINRNYGDLFVQTKMKGNFIDWTVGMTASYTDFNRDGKYRHALYQDNSFGKSKTYDFVNYGIKSNWLFKLDGRNFFSLSGQYSTNAPTADEVFINARRNDFAVPNLKSADIYSGEFSYILRAPRVKAKATGYYTLAKNEMEKNFGYIDRATGNSTLFAEVLNGVDKEYLGGEFGIEAQLLTTLTLKAAASIGQYTYKNNPDYYLYYDPQTLDELSSVTYGYESLGKSYLNKYHISAGPQQGYSLGLEYRNPHYWWVGVTGNYLMNNYIDIAPFNRTQQFIQTTDDVGNTIIDPNVTEEGLRAILKQHKTEDQFMLNANVGKSFRIGSYYAGISLTVNNVLNNKKYITGGYEQMRGGQYSNAIDPNYQNVFGAKYWYGQGTSYFMNVYFRF